MGKRKTPGVNASSSADIAFMLLLFFLMTSSMDTDQGLPRRLPQPVPKDQKTDTEVDIKKRNLLVVLVSSTNQIMCGGELTDIKQLKDKVKEFIDNPYNDAHLPETSYQAYIDVQNELARAYTELRDDISKKKFGKAFVDLDEDQQKAVQQIYPQKISEAEPKNYGGEN